MPLVVARIPHNFLAAARRLNNSSTIIYTICHAAFLALRRALIMPDKRKYFLRVFSLHSLAYQADIAVLLCPEMHIVIINVPIVN